jgi:hypothetical protein
LFVSHGHMSACGTPAIENVVQSRLAFDFVRSSKTAAVVSAAVSLRSTP